MITAVGSQCERRCTLGGLAAGDELNTGGKTVGGEGGSTGAGGGVVSGGSGVSGVSTATEGSGSGDSAGSGGSGGRGSTGVNKFTCGSSGGWSASGWNSIGTSPLEPASWATAIVLTGVAAPAPTGTAAKAGLE